jgi:hypothetical protein
MATEIISGKIPSLDITTQENKDLIIRPLAMVILANELILESMFAETTIEGILKSERLPDIIKSKMLKTFALINGIVVIGNSPADIYSQILFSLNNRNSNLSKKLTKLVEENTIIDSLVIIDLNGEELERNKLSYIQLESSKAMFFTRSHINNGTLLDGGYSRSDRLVYDEYMNSEKIVIPGAVDVVFSASITDEVLTVDMVDNQYTFPSGYYIDISPQAEKQFAIISDDKMVHGISKLEPVVFVEGGSPTEAFNVKRFVDPNFEVEIDELEIEVLDVLFKGKYPLLIDFTLYSTKEQDVDVIKNVIEEYFKINSRMISLLSPSEIMLELKQKAGIDVIVSSTNSGSLFFAVGKWTQQSITFPLTEKDFTIPDEITTSMITRRTVSAHVGIVTVVVE